MIRFLLATLIALALPAVAHAEVAEGSWALRIDDANIFVFVVERTDSGQWYGRWLRPASFRTNGAVFSQLTGSTETTSIAGREVAGEVELVFILARDSANPITFRFRQAGPGQVALTYVDTPLPPFPLVAVAEGAALGPFDPARIYDRDNAATRPPAGPASPLVPAPTPSSSPASAATPVVAPISPAPVAAPNVVGSGQAAPASVPVAIVPAPPPTAPANPLPAAPAAANGGQNPPPLPALPPRRALVPSPVAVPSVAPPPVIPPPVIPPPAAVAAPSTAPAQTPTPGVLSTPVPAAATPAPAPAPETPQPGQLDPDFLDDI